MATDIVSTLIEKENARCAAMLANDTAALDELLDARLVFSHATGQVDDKAAYCTKLAAGRIRYVAIVWDEQFVLPLSREAALVSGRMTSSVRVDGVEKKLENRVLAAWVESNGAWRLIAFQSTPLKG